MAKITFYGGIDEIGGNKFLVEDRGTRIFLDFGMQFRITKDYFSEFMQPRAFSISDMFKLGLLPDLQGLYRQDMLKHIGREENDPLFNAIVLTHAHADHASYVHYLRPDIPIYCSEASKLVLKAVEETSKGGGASDLVTLTEKFSIKPNKQGGYSKARGEERVRERKFVDLLPEKPVKIDSIEIEGWPVDHSIPGVMGLIVRTSEGSIACTADLRFHGRRGKDTEKFVEAAKGVDVLLCEGTRLEKTGSGTEESVENDIRNVIMQTTGLVVANWPSRDLDRLLSLYNACKASGRTLVLDMRQAYLLKLFEESELWKGVYPRHDDPNIAVYALRKTWGLIGMDGWPEEIVLQDYATWERELLGWDNCLNHKDIRADQRKYVFYCNDYQLKELFDIDPVQGSTYVRSVTEPFDDEMALDQEKVKNWLRLFGIPADPWFQTHVSGHGSREQIERIVRETEAKTLIPIHTVNAPYFSNWHSNVKRVPLGGVFEL